MLAVLLRRLADPFEFEAALEGLGLRPEDMPGLTREGRQLGGAAYVVSCASRPKP